MQPGLRRLDEFATGWRPLSAHRGQAPGYRPAPGEQHLGTPGRPDEQTGESPGAIYRRLRREMLATKRETILALRNDGRIDDEPLRQITHELDLEEAILSRYDEEL